MWVFLSESYLSIVQNKTNKDMLVVRARRKGDIEKVFPAASVYTLEGRDYQFRADVERAAVAEAMYRQVMDMTHTNFKDSVRDHKYHEACSSVWAIMTTLQPLAPYSRSNSRQRGLDY